MLVAREGHGINARVTRCAVILLLRADGAAETFQAQVGEAVRLHILANLLVRVRGGDQLRLAWRVHAVETGRNRWRATDPQVNLACSRRLDHAHDLAAGRVTDEGAIEQNNSAAV